MHGHQGNIRKCPCIARSVLSGHTIALLKVWKGSGLPRVTTSNWCDDSLFLEIMMVTVRVNLLRLCWVSHFNPVTTFSSVRNTVRISSESCFILLLFTC
jgi:hypothetical protein